MTNSMLSPSRLLASLASTLLVAIAPGLQAQWTAPTPEELSMTSIPQVAGAPAVYLFKEELADDAMHMQSFYVRLKVLTEGGKDFATVELPYVSGESGRSITDIAGRTIHPDGTIIPFTGKPYDKVVQKGVQFGQNYQFKVKVFSLPSVEVGSIIEYRYKLRIEDHYFAQPEWIVQSDLYTRKAHYMWKPTDRMLTTADGKDVTESVAWTPILPNGVTVKQKELPMQSYNGDGGHAQLDLDVADIAPLPKEQFMPPMQSLRYRVMFYYTSYRTAAEFWKAEGKRWARQEDKFIGPGPGVNAAVKDLIAPSDTPEQKLRKLYAAVMKMENTDFTRERSSSEERAQGLKDMNSTDDVLKRGRGTGDQLTMLFIAMARAAGMKSYAMAVADRNERLFLPNYLSVGQLDDDIAIVSVDGKDMFFDPGQRYCTFGQLAWKHAYSSGLRETDGGTDIAYSPAVSYKEEHTSRIADLKLDEHGVATGTVKVEYKGDAALVWRQDALRGDDTSLKNGLKTRLERELPGGLEISVTAIENLTDPDQPLKIAYDVKGPIGSSTGKRLLVPANLFEANSKPRFPEAKRDQPVDLHYASITQDAVRIVLPETLVVESAPAPGKAQIPSIAAFSTSSKSTPTSITLYRDFTMGKIIFPTDKYTDLRTFYNELEAKDQETLVLTHADPAKSGGGQ